jgi:NADH:ubiquinone oxidoreductase subunit E
MVHDVPQDGQGKTSTAAELSGLAAVLAPFPRRADELIAALRGVQDQYGYIPPWAIEPVALHVRVSRAKVLGVASFYRHFSLVPRGRHQVCVCRGTACHVRGSEQVLDTVARTLGVVPGQTTPDLNYTLQTVACVGACALAPVMTVDGEYYGKLDPAGAREVLARHGQEDQP